MKTNLRNSSLPGLLLMALLALALLAGCSAGDIGLSIDGVNIPPNTFPPYPNGRTVLSHGTVDDFGGLLVNGVDYSSTGATVTFDSEPAVPEDLAPGHIVTLTGRIGVGGFAGQASTIDAASRLAGPVESINAAGDRLSVMGQAVWLGPETRYAATLDPARSNGITVGDTIRVSGYADAAGRIRATRVEPVAAGTPLHVTGKVTALDSGAFVFTINGLTLDYGDAVLIELPDGGPASGRMVDAIGTLSDGRFHVGQLRAAPAVTGSAGRHVHLAGLVTRFASSTDFDIDTTGITTTSGTTFFNGSRSDLGLDAEIVVGGEFLADGRVRADRVTYAWLDLFGQT